jgi:LysM repeat protein
MTMKQRLKVLIGIAMVSNSLQGQAPADILTYVNTYKDLAVSEMQRTGIPASIILAQGIHETQAGTSDLVKQSNNHFGIKCKETWTGSVVHHDDDARGECFRSYNSPADSYKDHSDFLVSSPRYQFLFKLSPTNYEGWARGLKKAGYATNPQYSQILIRLIEDYNLQQYSLVAMGQLKPLLGQEDGQKKGSLPDAAAKQDPAVAGTVVYPEGEFMINETRVVFKKAGSSLLAISEQYNMALSRLLDFNDLSQEDVLINDQLLFLQRKRKTGSTPYHVVKPGETMYGICQMEGIRYESLMQLNGLSPGQEPASGEKIYLMEAAPGKPALAGEKSTQVTSPVDSSGKEKQALLAAPSPTAITHVVQSKETLFSISKKYGVDVQKIQEWNKLDSLNLRRGQELIIYKN